MLVPNISCEGHKLLVCTDSWLNIFLRLFPLKTLLFRQPLNSAFSYWQHTVGCVLLTACTVGCILLTACTVGCVLLTTCTVGCILLTVCTVGCILLTACTVGCVLLTACTVGCILLTACTVGCVLLATCTVGCILLTACTVGCVLLTHVYISYWGFEFRRGNGCLSLMNVVFCQLEDCASGWSLVQRSPTDSVVCLSVIVKPR